MSRVRKLLSRMAYAAIALRRGMSLQLLVANDHDIGARCSGSKSFMILIARYERAARRGKDQMARAEIDQAVFARCWARNAEMFRPRTLR